MPLEPSDRDRYQRRREIFLQVRDLPTAERSKYLDEACSGDADLRREVEALLASEEHSTDDPLAPLPVTPGGLNPPATKHPESVGPYKILGEPIGEGGMGIVYLAEQDHPRRKVALKLIRPGMTSTHVLRRFKYEAELLGRLQHPGIAQIYEAGSVDALDSEQPFFAMELVQGVTLTQYAEQKGLGTRDRLALLAGICDAVHHAHQQGIIHRDLKPKNILVTETGQPKVLDFGVARATDADLQSHHCAHRRRPAHRYRALHVARTGRRRSCRAGHAQRRVRNGRSCLRTAGRRGCPTTWAVNSSMKPCGSSERMRQRRLAR